MPALFIPHGGGPWPFVDLGLPRKDVDTLAGYLRQLRSEIPTPKALLVISAHWEADVPTVMLMAGGYPTELDTLLDVQQASAQAAWAAWTRWNNAPP